MNWEALGAIGETVGALGVIGTLVYLAVQIRQNTKSLRASTYQAVLDSARSDNELVLVHPHLERVYRVGRRDPTALTEGTPLVQAPRCPALSKPRDAVPAAPRRHRRRRSLGASSDCASDARLTAGCAPVVVEG